MGARWHPSSIRRSRDPAAPRKRVVSWTAVAAVLLLAGCFGPPAEHPVRVPQGLPSDACPDPSCEPGEGQRLVVVQVVDVDTDARVAEAAVALFPPGSWSPTAMARTDARGEARFVVPDRAFVAAASAPGSTTETAEAAADGAVTLRLFDAARRLEVDRAGSPAATGVAGGGRVDRFAVAVDPDPQRDEGYKARLRAAEYTLRWENALPGQHMDLYAVLQAPAAGGWQESTDEDDTLAEGPQEERARIDEAEAYEIRGDLAEGGLWVETRTRTAAIGVPETRMEHTFELTFRGADVRLVDA